MATFTGLPAGGVNISSGIVLSRTDSLNVSVTPTLILLVTCTGSPGVVETAPDGPFVSMTRSRPDGTPEKALPA